MQIKKRFSSVERDTLMDKASRCLWTDAGKAGRDYLFNVRKLSEEVAKEFKLGYIPEYVDHQLKGRIIFPLFDASNNLVAITSRALNKDGFLPVYWHESYEKSYYLYGVRNARESMEKLGFVIILEGQFDVLQMYNHGVHNVVGLSGTKMSQVQISIIQRYCDEIILLLDTDANNAGQAGTAKIEEASRLDFSSLVIPGFVAVPDPIVSRNIYSVSLPENIDPDEYILKYGINSLKNLIKEKRREFHNT